MNDLDTFDLESSGPSSSPNNLGAILCILVVGLFMCGLTTLFFVPIEKDDIDVTENRRLASFPNLTSEAVTSGAYTRGVEQYVNDHFPFRTTLLDLGYVLRDFRGFAIDGQVLVHTGRSRDQLEGWMLNDDSTKKDQDDSNERPPSVPKQSNHDRSTVSNTGNPLPHNTKAIGTDTKAEKPSLIRGKPANTKAKTLSASTEESQQGKATNDAKGKRTKPKRSTKPKTRSDRGRIEEGVLIYRGQAIELTGGILSSTRKYAALINKLRARLDTNIRIASVMAPTAVAIHASKNYAWVSRLAQRIIGGVSTDLSSGIHKIDGYRALVGHEDKYFYFRSDHHWTARGAYYVYRAFARSLGFAPIDEEHWDWKEGRTFLGSLYGVTRAPILKKNRDVLEYPNWPRNYTAKRYGSKWSSKQKGRTIKLVNPAARGYGAFLSGDHPLIVAKTTVKNGRHALLIKNSYGNAFVPFLLPHYETVAVIDYRYFDGHLHALIDHLKLTDIIFLNTNSHIGSGYHRRRIKKIIKIPKSWAPKVEPEIAPEETAETATKKTNSGPDASVSQQVPKTPRENIDAGHSPDAADSGASE